MPDALPLFTAVDLARLYRFPASAPGQTVGIILLGGGLKAKATCFETYFDRLGLPLPEITVVPVGGAQNRPAPYASMARLLMGLQAGSVGAPAAGAGAPSPTHSGGHAHLQLRQHRDLQLHRHPGFVAPMGSDPVDALTVAWTIEGIMDVELIGAMAPGAALRVYVADGGDGVDLDQVDRALSMALDAAIDDGVSVINASLGYPEAAKESWRRSESALKRAWQAGIPVCCASGNRGSTASISLFGPSLGVQFPASSPWSLAVGGTRLERDETGALVGEHTWNEQQLGARYGSGGGFSRQFNRPLWQLGLQRCIGGRRGVPDVAANASFSTGCWLWLQPEGGKGPQGINTTSTGTSAAAACWSALLSRLRGALGGAPLRVDQLYKAAARAALRSDLPGTNSTLSDIPDFVASAGWDPCTGLGAPDGEALYLALGGQPGGAQKAHDEGDACG